MKKVKVPTAAQIEKLKKKQKKDELRKQLAISADLLIKKKGSDEALDEKLKKEVLIKGKLVDVNKIFAYVNGTKSLYDKIFSQDYYLQIFRLNGWAVPANGIISQKPPIVGTFTRDIIYGRFPKEVIEKLEQENQFYNEYGMRLYKHYNLLTPEKYKEVEAFIKQSVEIMKRCSDWKEFVNEHGKEFGFPYQLSLFN